MLNSRISKATFDKLSEIEQSHYTAKGDAYVLDVNGDTEEMTQLRQTNVTLHQQVLAANSAQQQAEAASKTADTTAEAKYKAQLDTANERVQVLQTAAINGRKDAIIDGIASKFKQPELFRGVLKDQVKVEIDDKGNLVETFTNEKGEKLSLEQLSDSYCKAPQYSAMLTTPASTTTMPTNPAPTNPAAPTQQPMFNAPNQNSGATPTAATWSMGVDGKPVVHNWGAMSDQDKSAYATAKLAATTATQ